MEHIQTYEEFNEGFKTKLATMALAGALAVGTPSCDLNKMSGFPTEMISRTSTEDFEFYKVGSRLPFFKNDIVGVSNNGEVLCRYDGSSNNFTVTVNSSTNIIYYRIKTINGAGWLYVTNDPKYETNKDFTRIDLTKEKVYKETNEYKIVGSISGIYVLIQKSDRIEPDEERININGMDIGYLDVENVDFLIRMCGSW